MRATRILVIHIFHEDLLIRTLVIKSYARQCRAHSNISKRFSFSPSPEPGENKNAVHHAARPTSDERYTV
jgi:hypothetical protein